MSVEVPVDRNVAGQDEMSKMRRLSLRNVAAIVIRRDERGRGEDSVADLDAF
jgi:hypothetical protein